MNNLSFLVNKGNDFSKSEIKFISNNLFDLFNIDLNKIDLDAKKYQLEKKSEILKSFIETMNKVLYTELFEDDKDKLKIIKTIHKLQIQQELMELMASKNVDNAIYNLLKTSERFGKKAQSSVGKNKA